MTPRCRALRPTWKTEAAMVAGIHKGFVMGAFVLSGA